VWLRLGFVCLLGAAAPVEETATAESPFWTVLRRIASVLDTPGEEEVWPDVEALARSLSTQPGCAGLPEAVAKERERLRGADSMERRRVLAWKAGSELPDDPLEPPLGLLGVTAALQRALRLAHSGRYDRLGPAIDRAVAAAQEIGWDEMRARAELVRAIHLSKTSRPSEALEILDRIDGQLQELAPPSEWVIAVTCRSDVLETLGRFEESLKVIERLLQSEIARQDRTLRAKALGNRASTLILLGRPQDAVSDSKEALAAAREAADEHLAFVSLCCMGAAMGQLRRFGAALTCAERSEALARKANQTDRIAEALYLLAHARQLAGDWEGSAIAARESLTIYERIGSSANALKVRSLLARALTHLKRFDEAERELALVFRDACAARNRLRALFTLTELAELKRERGDIHGAIVQYERAVALAGKLGMEDSLVRNQGGLATLLALVGETDRALDLFNRALETASRLGNPLTEGYLRSNRVIASVMAGEFREAVVQADLVLTQTDGLRSGLGGLEMVDHRSGLARTVSQGILAAAEWARASSEIPPELNPLVFRLIERDRGRGLLEALLAAKDVVYERIPEELAEAEETARQALPALLARSGGVRAGEGTERASALREYARAAARVQRALASAGVPSLGDPVALGEFQARLGPHTAYLAFAETQADFLALLVTPRASRLVCLAGREEIDRMLSTFCDRLATPLSSLEEVTERGLPLHEHLLGPFREGLDGVSRLIVCPSASLVRLPFEALPLPGAAEGEPRFLVDRLAVGYAPSASLLAWLEDRERERPPGEGALVISAPRVADLDFLPHAEREADAVASLFEKPSVRRLSGKGATEPVLKAAVHKGNAARWRAVHFACHGLFDPDQPLLSSLVLEGGGPDSGEDGRLTAIEISRLRIPADLAMLSACHTAKGTWGRGEGLVGLVRAFFTAGSERVVVSHWAVEDEASAVLTRAFYEEFQHRGRPAAEALREAKLQLRTLAATGPAPLRGKLEPAATATRSDWRHPYYWASFVLWGRAD
jgi:CHAT domain-containing protein